jgi:starch phosphorylase
MPWPVPHFCFALHPRAFFTKPAYSLADFRQAQTHSGGFMAQISFTPAKIKDAARATADLALDAPSIREGMLEDLEFTLAEIPSQIDNVWEPYVSLAMTLRKRLLERWIKTHQSYYDHDARRVYYLSLEFLMGRTLGNAMINLGALDQCAAAANDLGLKLEDLRDAEWDAGLGNGGLGRLAACYLDSMATLQIPNYGYGIRYDYGIFHQRIVDGAQVEVPDAWLRYGNPWEVARPLDRMRIQFHGYVHQFVDVKGRLTNKWVDTEDVLAVPYDTPVPGYMNGTVNTLRLWGARATEEFDFRHFNAGDYVGAVHAKDLTENITKVLYPNDNIFEGRELRLKQEYFFVSATIQDIIRRYKKQYRVFDQPRGLETFDRFADRVAIQLNDTHPTFAVPELMRILIDIEELDWDEAWEITCKVFGYTNHTVLPEALERWPVALVEKVLPRHLQIIYEINARFLSKVRQKLGDDDARLRRMSIIEEGNEKRVRMANLAIVGSHSVNGVAELHSNILKNEIFPDFAELWPEKFNNKTNGITQRRWLLKCNPPLAKLISDAIGDKWITDLYELKKLVPLCKDGEFVKRWREAKRWGKDVLIKEINHQYQKRGVPIKVSPDTMFDCQVKRIHEYKRQLLNLLGVITHYNRLKDGKVEHATPRTVIFGGKAAPGYFMAKNIIRLINFVGDAVNNDPATRDLLQVVFLADYRVSLAERVFPAADLSEQISTAGTEASGTGNMKFALNGAVTIGTMDGANIEIRQEVGDDNIFIFGMTAEQVRQLQSRYNPWDFYNANEELRRTLDMIRDGAFSPRDRGTFRPIVDALLQGGDRYMLLADFESYVNCQRTVGQAYADQTRWTSMSIQNVAHMGKFSSDRSIQQYCDEIWKVKPVRPE